MIGDGESQEGQVWEAADVATKYNLDNLIVIMDYNKLQQFGWEGSENRERENPVFNPSKRWEAFGWNVIEIDGHDFEQIINGIQTAKNNKQKPTIIIAHTVKGKGISFMEDQYLWHSKVPTQQELEAAIAEIQVGV
jgi:transketolase